MRARALLLLLFGAASGAALGAGGVAWVRSRAPGPQADVAESARESEPEPRGRRVALGTAGVAPGSTPAANIDQRWIDDNKQAVELLERGEHARAVQLLEACHEAVPAEPVFAANLAEALARLSNAEVERGGAEERASALAHLRRAVALAPERPELAQRLAQLERLTASEEGLWTDSSEHFELSYDGERNELLAGAHGITALCETAYQDFGELFAHWPVDHGTRAKIRVVLYRRAGFHDATGIGHWAGGLYDGTVRIPVEDLGKEKRVLERVLRHEIAHAFVAAVGGSGVPAWLNEGLAQRLESPDLVSRAADVAAARKRLAGRELLPLPSLQKGLGARADAEEIALAYAQALAMTEHVERTWGERVPYRMVEGCKRDVPVEKTFEELAGLPLDSVVSDLAREL